MLFNAKNMLADEGGFDLLVTEIKTKIALDIISTRFDDNTRREELYMLSKAVDELAMKLQGYVNELESENN